MWLINQLSLGERLNHSAAVSQCFPPQVPFRSGSWAGCAGWLPEPRPWESGRGPWPRGCGEGRASGSRWLGGVEVARPPRYKIWTLRSSINESKLVLLHSNCLPWHGVQTRSLLAWAKPRPDGLRLSTHSSRLAWAWVCKASAASPNSQASRARATASGPFPTTAVSRPRQNHARS